MPTYTDPVFIDGNQDDPQLRVQAHTTQTDPLQTWENSSGAILAQVSGSGQLLIDGSQDVPQVRVQAHSTQNQPLQVWEASGGGVLSQVTNDGRLEVGNNAVGGAPVALVEANQGNIGAASAVKQGLQSRGVTNGAIAEALTWSVHELELGGSGGVSGNHTGLRSKITQSNTGGGSAAELRAGEFKVENNQTLNKAVAVRAEISNASGGNITEAAALEAILPALGTIGTLYGLRIPDLLVGTNRYAIKTGRGAVQLGDAVDIKNANPSVEPIRLKIGDGAFLGGRTNWNSLLEFSGGAEYTASGWIARDTTATLISCFHDEIDIFCATGLTVGNTFSWGQYLMMKIKPGRIYFYNIRTAPGTPETNEVYRDANGFLKIG